MRCDLREHLPAYLHVEPNYFTHESCHLFFLLDQCDNDGDSDSDSDSDSDNDSDHDLRLCLLRRFAVSYL